MSVDHIVNLAAYRFVALDDLEQLRKELRDLSRSHRLRGTILIAPEGINFFVAGEADDADAFLHDLTQDTRFAEIEVKRSLSDRQPFHRMLVRIKREIIPCGLPDIVPEKNAAPKITATELKRWLDEGRVFSLLDVRNDYEIALGTFEGAIPAGISHFRDFPQAVQQLNSQLKGQPVVMFCTGGIRCEKAAPVLQQAGVEDVLQLDGGILKYFEECGGDHYQGECFVFDQRVAVDAQLNETATEQCFACQAPLSSDDQQSPYYVLGQSCPHCFIPQEQQQRERLVSRQRAIRLATDPLPGSEPYENRLPINVPARFDSYSLVDFLDASHPHVGRQTWAKVCAAGQLVRNGEPVTADHMVHTAERYERILPETVEPDVNVAVEILFEDEAIIVVNKPAPLPMHPSGRFHRNTLQHILRTVYHPICPRNAHRLDANTSGVVVFSKTRRIASCLQPQFQEGTVKKQYLARVHGCPREKAFACDTAISEKPQQAGARTIDPQGRPALTKFELLESCSLERESLILARPITGRTNQIRIHLWSLGFSVLGDPVYRTGGELGRMQTLDCQAPPMCLHAWQLEFRHPITKEPVQFTAPKPCWADLEFGNGH
ncbi:MAG: sulfurtransferase [Pirellulaceae bacterium]|nr:sulfurtransferase [Pirellulaceae bacterium]